MDLSREKQKYLCRLAQKLKPVILVGQNGLTDSVMEELDAALNRHELVKIKIRCEHRKDREQIIKVLSEKSHAFAVQKIGSTLTLFRRNPDKPVITLP